MGSAQGLRRAHKRWRPGLTTLIDSRRVRNRRLLAKAGFKGRPSHRSSATYRRAAVVVGRRDESTATRLSGRPTQRALPWRPLGDPCLSKGAWTRTSTSRASRDDERRDGHEHLPRPRFATDGTRRFRLTRSSARRSSRRLFLARRAEVRRPPADDGSCQFGSTTRTPGQGPSARDRPAGLVAIRVSIDRSRDHRLERPVQTRSLLP